MNFPTFYVSSCQTGGLYQFDSWGSTPSLLANGNIRGITSSNSAIFCVKDDKLCKVANDSLNIQFSLPCHGHDIKYDKESQTFLFVGTPNNTIYELSQQGEIINQMILETGYWPNCLSITNQKNLVIFLSSRRPNPASKIVVSNRNFHILWEYICHPHDEIHSPYTVGDELYWCCSNKNSVMKCDLKFQSVNEIIRNEAGYTRGLAITDQYLLLGTSENRHAENSKCISRIPQGCVHLYKNNTLIKSTVIQSQEVYDILICDHHVKTHL